MSARATERIESAVDAGAAALFAAAAAYALFAITANSTVIVAALPAFGLCFAGLRRVAPTPSAGGMALAAATPVADLLAEADRSLAHAEDELVLDDILAALKPDSRVVQLFARDETPTAGQLKDRIDRHFDGAPPHVDASQALNDALAELRRSLK